jgi:hypothetical protein
MTTETRLLQACPHVADGTCGPCCPTCGGSRTAAAYDPHRAALAVRERAEAAGYLTLCVDVQYPGWEVTT